MVENELLISMDIAQALEQAGAHATMTTTVRHALILIEHDGLAGAIMDHGLSDGDSTQVCARLKKRSRRPKLSVIQPPELQPTMAWLVPRLPIRMARFRWLLR